MNAPIVDDMVEVQCSCGRFHRLPSRIREFRCACHMTIGVNIDPYVSSEFIAPLPAPRVGLPPSPMVDLLPTIDAPARPVLPKLDRSMQSLAKARGKQEDDGAWKNEMLDVMERVAELEDLLHQQTQKLERMAELERELEQKKQDEARYKEALDQIKPIVEDWERLEQENARLSRLMSVARDRGRVDLKELLRRAKMLKTMKDLF